VTVAGREARVHPTADATVTAVPVGPAPTFDELVGLARSVVASCRARGLTIATAESCTGGLVGHALTEVPGASAAYRGGVVAYANDAKSALLDVDAALLARHGAVSAEVAEAMAVGVRRRMGTDLAVAVTGVAGPDGGTAEKPVGLAYVCVSAARGARLTRCLWPHDRAGNKRASASVALAMLEEAAGESSERSPDRSRPPG
jgi:PncC family amidohydrolase